MPTIQDWERELRKKDIIDLLEIQHALRILNKWDFYEQHFGVRLLRVAVKIAVDNIARELA